MTDVFRFDKKEHAYFLNNKPMLGCTSVLGVIAKPALIQWAANCAVDYLYDELITRGTDASIDSYKVFKDARTAHIKKRDKAADAGTDLHALVEKWVGRCITENGGRPVGGKIDLPIKKFIDWAVKENVRFIASEQRLFSKSLWVAGTCDLIFEKDGKRYIGDIKTYKKIWDRVPLIQCAGYALMWEEMFGNEHEVGRIGLNILTHKDERIDGYCVICLPKERAFNEAEDVLWSFDTEGDREAFVSAVKLYKYLNQK